MHFQTTTTLLASALALTATAAPLSTRATTPITAEILISIAPSTASCSGATFPAECADAKRAAPAITAAFEKYKIASQGEQSALIAIMLFESGNFAYNKNHFPAPGRPGQGTKNMQSAAFNLQYAKSLFDAAKVDQANAQGPDAVLQLVSGDAETFASAAWFLATQCSKSVRDGLATGGQAGWSAYLTQCVGTTDTADRDQGWQAVTKALGGGAGNNYH